MGIYIKNLNKLIMVLFIEEKVDTEIQKQSCHNWYISFFILSQSLSLGDGNQNRHDCLCIILHFSDFQRNYINALNFKMCHLSFCSLTPLPVMEKCEKWGFFMFPGHLVNPLKRSFCWTDPCLSRRSREGEFRPFLLFLLQPCRAARDLWHSWSIQMVFVKHQLSIS